MFDCQTPRSLQVDLQPAARKRAAASHGAALVVARRQHQGVTTQCRHPTHASHSQPLPHGFGP